MDTSSRSALTSNGAHGVGDSLRHMVDEIDHFLKSAAASGDQRLDAVREKLSHQVREMRSQLDELNEATVARVKRAAMKADETVQAHPYSAMGVAAAAGLLIGFLAARR